MICMSGLSALLWVLDNRLRIVSANFCEIFSHTSCLSGGLGERGGDLNFVIYIHTFMHMHACIHTYIRNLPHVPIEDIGGL